VTTEILRAGLLAGIRALVAAPPGSPRFAPAVAARATALGAAVERVQVDPGGDEAGIEGELGLLVWDASAAGSALAAIDGAWLAVRPVATRAMGGGGLIVMLAPPPGDAQAEAARAGLETMARTLSIEWARLAIRPIAILPGAATPAGEVAELVAYLASPAGAYFSGCRFDLGSS
jgi:NAD(P)-dependent dehydrogenase (short-subunit alcohol dehydrogenase family)